MDCSDDSVDCSVAPLTAPSVDDSPVIAVVPSVVSKPNYFRMRM